MLKCLTNKNYKCFGDFVFDFDPDVRTMLLLGNNGSGKTSLAGALEILQKANFIHALVAEGVCV